MAGPSEQDEAGPDREEQPKLFTHAEASALLPEVRRRFTGLRARADRANEVLQLRTDMVTYWGEAVEDPTNPEHARFTELTREAEETVRSVTQGIGELEGLGVHVKDLQVGLVDFFALREKELVLLCWRYDEESIAFWHDLTSGFNGRRPMSEF